MEKEFMLYSVPPNEVVWERIEALDGSRYVITSDRRREMYYIYKIVKDSGERLGKGKNPPDLIRRYIDGSEKA